MIEREDILRTRRAHRRACVAAAIALVGLAGCGGSSNSSDEIVARVAGVGSVSKATLAHWTGVEAVVLYQETPLGPVPKGVLPDPPSYGACIAFLRETGQRLVNTGPPPTTAQLKSKCAEKLQKLRVLTLNTLLDWDWTIGAAQQLGMKVTSSEIKRRYEEVSGRLFPAKGELASYLERTGQTVPDMLFRAKVQLFEVKQAARLAELEKLIPKNLSAKKAEATLAELAKGVRTSKQWAALTSCQPGYVTSACAQYKGTEAPGYPN